MGQQFSLMVRKARHRTDHLRTSDKPISSHPGQGYLQNYGNAGVPALGKKWLAYF